MLTPDEIENLPTEELRKWRERKSIPASTSRHVLARFDELAIACQGRAEHLQRYIESLHQRARDAEKRYIASQVTVAKLRRANPQHQSDTEEKEA